MSNYSCVRSSEELKKCYCGHPIAVQKSSTVDNPGRRFECCKLYNPTTKIRGCKYFRWIDITQTDWQRHVINKLNLENKMLTSEMEMMKEELKSLKEDKSLLGMEVDKLKKKLKSLKEETTKSKIDRNSNGNGVKIMIYVIVGLVVLWFSKLF
ncbi:hypothetical protein RND81_03G206100 [Saponaria officinalis]|uniref:GRF-type domain-containing protein n=1 Tax=Saponaria officinalis TaxID=3572 RepID=A0AAW1M1P9_SAPOF